MKKYLLLFLAIGQSVALLAQDNHRVPYLTRSLAGDAISSLAVSTSAGGIMVSGRAGEAPRVEVYIRGNNGQELTKEEIKKRLDEDYDMNIAVNGHALSATVKTRHEFRNWDHQMSISFRIYVPREVSTDLKTSGGGIELDNLKGTETFTTSGGGLHIDKLSGTIHGRTSGGGIEVTNSTEDIDLHTSGGGIMAKDCEGKMSLVTSGGGLRLENLKGNITAHTSGGGVEGRNIQGELITGTSGGSIELKEMDCSLQAGTSAGSIRAQMKKVGQYLRLNTSAGNIYLELPDKQGLDLNLSAERIDDHILSGFTGDWKNNHVTGSVNGGGAAVNAHASNGSIEVRYN